MMVEVFKTDVQDRTLANSLLDLIRQHFPFYKVNFDLEDCDHILRIASEEKEIDVSAIVNLLKDAGCVAELLPENDVPESVMHQN